MTHSTGMFLFPFKCLFIAVLIIGDIFLVILLLHMLQVFNKPLHAYSAQTNESLPFAASINSDIKQTVNAFSTAISATTNTVGNVVGSATHAVTNTTASVVRGAVTTVTNPETIIKPEPAYDLPEIKAVAEPTVTSASSRPALKAETPSKPQVASAQTAPAPSPGVWPVKGYVTTEFGVPHRPYQPRHTGMDISSHLPNGRAAITPFREGVVTQVIRSSRGLGNHVIVDHGGGVTSYYCHLSSIAVREGQTVKPGDTIGNEGRTGTATGPHLHFEIRQNGAPVNPRTFITGNP